MARHAGVAAASVALLGLAARQRGTDAGIAAAAVVLAAPAVAAHLVLAFVG